MKQKIFAALFIASVSSTSFAYASAPVNDYYSFYTTAASGDTTPQSTFSWDSKPWLYIQLTHEVPQNPHLQMDSLQSWYSPTATVLPTYTNVINLPTTNHTNGWWTTIPDASWDVLKKPGTWTITALGDSFNTNAPQNVKLFSAQTSFQVNAAPEPISSVLFIIGALVMGLSVIRRKKFAAIAA